MHIPPTGANWCIFDPLCPRPSKPNHLRALSGYTWGYFVGLARVERVMLV